MESVAQETTITTNGDADPANANSAQALEDCKNAMDIAEEKEGSTGGNNSSGSSNGRGSGSGGYNADCSSSDGSSSDASSKRKKNNSPELSVSVENLALDGGHQEKKRRSSDKDKEGPDSNGHDRNAEKKHGSKSSTREQEAARASAQDGVFDAILEQRHNINECEPLSSRGRGTLPQWNGIRISSPMDPRIDISTVGFQFGDTVGNGSSCMNLTPAENRAAPAPSLDNYLHLMEAVRPFFMAYGIVPPGMPTMPPAMPPAMPTIPTQSEKGGSENTNEAESEGFTAFFTTTEKSGSSDSQKETSSDSQDAAAGSPQQEDNNMASLPPQHEQESAARQNSEEEESDSSSMVVLARVKSKYKKGQNAEENGDESNASVHQQDGGEDAAQRRQDAGDTESQNNALANAEAAEEHPQEASSGSSSSEANPPILRAQQGHPNMPHPGPNEATNQLRIVSEVSSTTNTTTNTSGSGSNGNSGSGSGSNSNQGSSGSGNDNQGSSGSGGEGKNGSSEDVAKDDNSGGNSANSMEVEVSAKEEEDRKLPALPDESSVDDNESREKRVQDKKRKRMNMRRVYEKRVQRRIDSESSQEEVDLRPGKPVTLDAILSFTKNARVVVQATPPFLVVHANAAYTGLTGIDAHSIIGKPVRAVLSMPDSKDRFEVSEINNADGSHSGQSSMTNSARTNNHHQDGRPIQQANPRDNEHQQQQVQEMNNILSHAAAAAAGEARAISNEMKEMNIERLVAACGFGRVHLLNVTSKAHRMLGRNVTFIPEARGTGDQTKRDGESQGSSIPSMDGPFEFVTCRTGVSPVISSANAVDSSAVVTDQEQNKRRKHHHYHHHSHRRHASKNNLLTHYVIQFERIVKAAQGNPQRSRQSESSTSKSDLPSPKAPTGDEQDPVQPPARGDDEVAEEGTDTTDPKEPVSMIG